MKGHPLSRLPFDFSASSSRNHAPISLNKSYKDQCMKKSTTKQGIVKTKSSKKLCVYQSLESDKQNTKQDIVTFGNYTIKETQESMHNNAYKQHSMPQKQLKQTQPHNRLADKATTTFSFDLSILKSMDKVPYNLKHGSQQDKRLQNNNQLFQRSSPILIAPPILPATAQNHSNKVCTDIKTNLKQQQLINSGYGTIHNPYPQYLQPSYKFEQHCQQPLQATQLQTIDFSNLYNIGRYWYKFEGSFQNGNKQGPGNIYLTNGILFSGYFKDDLANGKGAVHVDGTVRIRGTWKDNKLVTQY